MMMMKYSMNKRDTAYAQIVANSVGFFLLIFFATKKKLLKLDYFLNIFWKLEIIIYVAL